MGGQWAQGRGGMHREGAAGVVSTLLPPHRRRQVAEWLHEDLTPVCLTAGRPWLARWVQDRQA